MTLQPILTWILDNPDRTFAWFGGTCVLAWRALPENLQEKLETDYPRLANIFRVLRAIGPDFVKGLSASKNIMKGLPWREGTNDTPNR